MRMSDWSSDVGSSDLAAQEFACRPLGLHVGHARCRPQGDCPEGERGHELLAKILPCFVRRYAGDAEFFHFVEIEEDQILLPLASVLDREGRSEERRVGKEGVRPFRSWWSPSQY